MIGLPPFMAVIPDEAIVAAVASVWISVLAAIKVLYTDSKRKEREARDERKEMLSVLDRLTEAVRQQAIQCLRGQR